MPKQVGNTAHILAYVFNSVSRECHEVWTSKFLFPHNFKDVLPPSKDCFNGCINCSLAQAQ